MKLNIEQAISSSFHHQSNGQGKAYIKFVKYTMHKCCDTNADVNLAVLQIRSTPVALGLPS